MSDAPSGLIHCKRLDGAGGALDLDWIDVGSWTPEQGCLWLHFDFADSGAREWISVHSGLNDIATDALLTDETRPRAVSRGDNLLLSLRGINLSPGSDPDDMVSIRIWTDGTRIVSTRRRPLQSTTDIINDLAAGVGPRSAADMLVAWTDRITERMRGTLDGFEDQVAGMEERILAGEFEGLRIELAQLRKQSIMVRRYLAPQREALNRLCNEPLGWLDDMNRLRLREVNDRLIRHIEDIDAVRERAAMTQDELLGLVSEEMNQRSYVFTVVATIFLPLGFFTGLMGINVGGMPGVEDKDAFWVVVLMCVAVTGLMALLFRFKRWL